jgi:hypothetical protein
MIIAETALGLALIAIASALFTWIGREDFSSRVRNFPMMDCIVVLIILGGWSAGISILINVVVYAYSG